MFINTAKSSKWFEVIGNILNHVTKVMGKTYTRAKLYLKGDSYVGKSYELYDLGEVEIKECMGTIKGKGLLIFIPGRKRSKEVIGFGD